MREVRGTYNLPNRLTFFGVVIYTYPPGRADPAVRQDFGIMAVLMSVASRAGQVPMGIRLNRFKEACTWVLAYRYETTPIVIPLENCYIIQLFWTSNRLFWPLLDSGGGFTSETALPKRQYHSRFGSETAINS
jgi:hypothetical protein